MLNVVRRETHGKDCKRVGAIYTGTARAIVSVPQSEKPTASAEWKRISIIYAKFLFVDLLIFLILSSSVTFPDVSISTCITGMRREDLRREKRLLARRIPRAARGKRNNWDLGT